MIFLGAGASKALGLKTMQDLTKDLVGKMKAAGYGDTVEEVLGALKKFHLTPDFENIYTTLLGLANPLEGIKQSGPLSAFFAARSNFDLDMHTLQNDSFRNALLELRDLIYDECTIQRGVIEAKKSLFDKLFQATSESHESRQIFSKLGSTGTVDVDVGRTIATTNYDMAVELYHRWTSNALSDGFATTRKEYVKEFDLHEFGKNATSRWLLKLHGSIWQFKQGNRIIQTMLEPKSLPLNISVGEQMMIYPVGEKPILQDPYFSLYTIFKEQPWSILIAIGYSFRDEPVNVAILERLGCPDIPRAKLVIVNPHADLAASNLNPPAELQKRIIPINEHFREDDSLFHKIALAIASRDRSEFLTSLSA
jgi:hypothetical protein